MTQTATLTEADVAEAKRIWEQYQREHDVVHLLGQAAGIDPKTGEVWIGDDIVDLVFRRKADSLTSPLFFVRIGAATFYVKGWRA
jgi:hypothetical protein